MCLFVFDQVVGAQRSFRAPAVTGFSCIARPAYETCAATCHAVALCPGDGVVCGRPSGDSLGGSRTATGCGRTRTRPRSGLGRSEDTALPGPAIAGRELTVFWAPTTVPRGIRDPPCAEGPEVALGRPPTTPFARLAPVVEPPLTRGAAVPPALGVPPVTPRPIGDEFAPAGAPLAADCPVAVARPI